MQPRFTPSLELLEEVQRKNLYPALLRQLDKDFARAGVAIDLPGEPSFGELGALVQEKIYFLILERFQDYLNLLYVADIPEHQVRLIKASDAVDLSAAVGFLLLSREAQKVWYRSRYGS